jgi:hypothetical protein
VKLAQIIGLETEAIKIGDTITIRYVIISAEMVGGLVMMALAKVPVKPY